MRKTKQIEALCLELASEGELEAVAEGGSAEQKHAARALLLERARHWAHLAAVELTAALSRVKGGAS